MIMTPDEFTKHISAFSDKLYRFAHKMLNDSERAKDAVQDVCMKLWRQRDQLHAIENLEAWCMRLIKNRCIDLLRSPANKVDNLDKQNEKRAYGHSPDAFTEQKDTLHRIKSFMKKLPQKQSIVMHLRDVEGMSYQEIADLMDITMPQVKITLFRARKAIRTQLENANAYGL